MWLLQVHDLRFLEVPSHEPFPDYAILSHVWLKPNSEEITFQDLLSQNQNDCGTKKGWQNLIQFVQRAKSDELEYIWIDTCCMFLSNR